MGSLCAKVKKGFCGRAIRSLLLGRGLLPGRPGLELDTQAFFLFIALYVLLLESVL